MATVVINQSDIIEFKNFEVGKSEDTPTLTVQAGAFQVNDHGEVGIVVDVTGAEAPFLTPVDARKLAKWLVRAADVLDSDSKEKRPKNNRHRHHDEQDDGY